jgi:hypothetical protein
MDGVEKVIKKSAKPFEHASFNKVITGAVKRMEKLFAPEHLNLEVIIYKKPNINQLEISFELVNKNIFKIGNEDYFASIMCEYSYAKMNVVTYYPIIYRQVCSNGMVSVMSKNFTESISTDKIFDIGCEWSKCTFETYQRKLKEYFEILQFRDDVLPDEPNDNFEAKAIRKMERVLKISIPSEKNRVTEVFDNSNNVSSNLSINHWIPFTEQEVNAQAKFESRFMTDFIQGKIKTEQEAGDLFGSDKKSLIPTQPLVFSDEARAVFDAGRALWTYYHAQKGVNSNASLYDIREHFQGRNEAGKMNNKSQDEQYNQLIASLRESLKTLAKKIEPKVYEYGFLKG